MIESPTRPDRTPDRATDAPTEGRHSLPIRSVSGCSSSLVQLKSGRRGLRRLRRSAETEPGRLGRPAGLGRDQRWQARRQDREAFNDIWSQIWWSSFGRHCCAVVIALLRNEAAVINPFRLVVTFSPRRLKYVVTHIDVRDAERRQARGGDRDRDRERHMPPGSDGLSGR